MRNIQTLEIKVGAEPVEASNYERQLLALNDARLDERKNLAAVFAARLEALAAYLIRHDASGRGAAETLQQEAERIRNESWEIH